MKIIRESLALRKLGTIRSRLGYSDQHLAVSREILANNRVSLRDNFYYQQDVLKEIRKQTAIFQSIVDKECTKT